MSKLSSYLILSVLATGGCGGATTLSTDDAAADGASDSSATDAASGTDAVATDAFTSDVAASDGATEAATDAVSDASATCPASAPAPSSPCAPDGLECTYGSDPRLTCRTDARCSAGKWDVSAPPCSIPPTCPTPPPVDGALCDATGITCASGAESCLCYACIIPCSLPAKWHCSTPLSGCPTTAPNLGSPCSTNGVTCDYGSCLGGWKAMCDAGKWTRVSTPCPG
jgi:hypothetical protein